MLASDPLPQPSIYTWSQGARVSGLDEDGEAWLLHTFAVDGFARREGRLRADTAPGCALSQSTLRQVCYVD